MKKVIKLTESELKNIIKESVKKVLNETKHLHESFNDSEYIKDEIELWELDLSEEVSDFLEDYNGKEYDTVSVEVEVINEPYNSGDYWTPPSGGVRFSDCKVDTDGKFKAILPDKLYDDFTSAVYDCVYSHSEDYEEQIKHDNEWREE